MYDKYHFRLCSAESILLITGHLLSQKIVCYGYSSYFDSIKLPFMVTRQQFIALSVISLLVASGIAATAISGEKPKNLKVLPKDISEQKLDSIMHSYNKALGVNCAFCHSPYDKKFPDSLNYVSDENNMKEEARKMMRLTIQLNKDYFYFDTLQRPEYLRVVTCYTCHRGDPFPADLQ